MTSTQTSREPHGFKVWFAVLGGVGAWMTHLVAEASLARRTCTHGDDWIVHLATILLAGVVVVAMLLSAQLRTPPGAEGELRGELHFLGKLGLLLGAINLLLILFEGVLLFWIPSCG